MVADETTRDKTDTDEATKDKVDKDREAATDKVTKEHVWISRENKYAKQ